MREVLAIVTCLRYDQSLQLLMSSLSDKDFISKDDFEKVWTDGGLRTAL